MAPETVESIAADLIALLFSEGLMARGRTLAEMCIAAGVPLRSLRQAQQRLQDGFMWSPADYRPRRGSRASQKDRRKPNRVIPDDATEWVCRSDGATREAGPSPSASSPGGACHG